MKLLQLTDLHFGTYPFQDEDKRTEAMVRRLIREQEPDMLIITGDIYWSLEEGSLEILSGVLDFFDSFNIPVAIVWGNHDSEGQYDRSAINDLIKKMEHHVSKIDCRTVEGRELYYYDVPSYRLYFLDSGDYDEEENYAYIYEKQIEDILAIDHPDREGLLFMHIPVDEYGKAKEEGLAVGNQDERVCSPKKNKGLFDALRKDSAVRHLFVGHDHDNDFSATYEGMNLNYGRVSGYNAYGKLPRGGRIIELNEEGLKSYILEDIS